MGVSIYYRPVSDQQTNITPGARSQFLSVLEETFGAVPIRLNGNHLQLLQAMQRAATDTDFKESFGKLIQGVEKHDEIEVLTAY
jgi:hypothetical protein